MLDQFDDKFTLAAADGNIRLLKKLIPQKEHLKERFACNVALSFSVEHYHLRTFKFLLKNIDFNPSFPKNASLKKAISKYNLAQNKQKKNKAFKMIQILLSYNSVKSKLNSEEKIKKEIEKIFIENKIMTF